ncbi:MAG: hypothetical protein O3A20_07370 [Planctomycetota bacterium]|nr:hypothetical protein [Planctomycetota bacterium]
MKNLLLIVAVALIGACANYTPKAEKACCAEAEAKGEAACCAEMGDCAAACEDMAAMQCCKDAAALGKECTKCEG